MRIKGIADLKNRVINLQDKMDKKIDNCDPNIVRGNIKAERFSDVWSELESIKDILDGIKDI